MHRNPMNFGKGYIYTDEINYNKAPFIGDNTIYETQYTACTIYIYIYKYNE